MNRIPRILAPAALLAALLGAPAPGLTGPSDGVLLRVGGGHLKVAFCAEDVMRVAFARNTAFFDRPSLAAGVRRCQEVKVERADGGGQATFATPKMKVRVDLGTGRVAFLDAQGASVLVETSGSATRP